MHEEQIKSTYLSGERLSDFDSLSGFPYQEIYRKSDWEGDLPDPGQYPYTRGIHKNMYRGRLWTRRQQSGFGAPEESNERLKYLLKVGQTGINMDADIVTKLGLDPDYPLAQGDVGLTGTSLFCYEDMRALFKGIPLDEVSSTLIVQPPYSAVIMCHYLLLAQERAVPWEKLVGTIMNCAFTQFVGPTLQSATTFFPLDLSLKIGLDVMEYMLPRSPRWNILNLNAYNVRETGVNAVQEAAFSMALAADYIKALINRGHDVDTFARRMAFFTAAHLDLFEEIAKLRAMRRIWARMLKEQFKAGDERSMYWRTAIQTAALPLTAQEPLNNIVRATLQTLAAVLAGAQSIHTTGYDEAYSLPTEESHKLSVRTQQIIAYESKAANTVDPLGGSYMIEKLTNRMEEEIWELMRTLEDKGGFIECFKQGWIEEQINQARYGMADDIESGKRSVIGVNLFHEQQEEPEINIFRTAPDMQQKRIAYARRYKAGRDAEAIKSSTGRLGDLVAANADINYMDGIMEAVRNRATLQEICDAMRQAAGFTIPK